MSNQPKFGFFLEYVPDIEAAKHFYHKVLGLEIERNRPEFVQFDHFAIASDESMSGTRDSEVYWLVESVETAFKDFSQKAEIIPPLKQIPFGKIFGNRGPAGQPFYLLEFTPTRPSRSRK